jgi:arylsulfatase A-like enzyme
VRFATGLGLVIASVVLATAARAADRPNVVFILADDLGIHDLGCYGRAEHRTPRLDRLASEGTRFTCAYAAQPICSPSRAAILTGKAPARLHLTTYLPGRPDAPSQKLLQPKICMELPLEETTLAERLRAAGYATACIGKWHLGGPGFGPEQQGFDVVHPGSANTRPSEQEGGKGEFDLTRASLAFIEENRDRPFFLYLAHNTPHIPLGAAPERVAENRDAFNPTYAAMMQVLDESVGRLLDRLEALRLADRTIVVFTSDNGGLHVLESPDSPATHNTPFRAGKGFLYEGGLRVPLIVRWPGHVPAGRVVPDPVINTDWTPTLAEFCGADATGMPDGASLAGLLRGEAAPRRALFWHFPHYTNQGGRPGGAVREGVWKLILHEEDGRAELYNLADDPSERNDRSAQEPSLVDAMKSRLEAWRRDVDAQENTINPHFDASRHRRLYVDHDVSRLLPGRNAAETGSSLRAWRAEMNAVIRPATGPGASPR